jgi:serine/threonine-protein kinase HipA
MTSDTPRDAFVWVWLPRASDPVVAGRLTAVGDIVEFNYGRSYLQRDDAIPLYLPELPLWSGLIAPPDGMSVAGCIDDAGPDAWGQRVIMQHVLGGGSAGADPADLHRLTYLLESGSDRIGALDFQESSDVYVGRDHGNAPLDELAEVAARVDAGVPLSPALDRALLHGSSVGGARPKALVDGEGRKFIAKFSSSTDTYEIVRGEFIAMELARRAGLDVAPVTLARALGKDVLLVERFDRVEGTTQRRALVSALTILELDEMMARYASYAKLAQRVRERFVDAPGTLRELFARITFNILVGNTDDHARNHAAFWDGEMLRLTPAYDICPQGRAGGEATQAMTIGPDGFRMSQLAGCVASAATYLLSETDARAIIDHQVRVIEAEWTDVCDLAELPAVARQYFWHRQFLNPYAFYDYSAAGAP